jgi:hypothetical protein
MRFVFFALLFILPACSSTGSYRPIGGFENDVFQRRADTSLTPKEIRKSPEKYLDSLVAWVGEVEKVDFEFAAQPQVARVLARYNAVDWEGGYDFGKDTFSSARPEREYFQIALEITGPDTLAHYKKIQAGDNVVAYGYPREIFHGVVGLYPLVYFRPLGFVPE